MFTLADNTPKIQTSHQFIFSPDLRLIRVSFSQHFFLRKYRNSTAYSTSNSLKQRLQWSDLSLGKARRLNHMFRGGPGPKQTANPSKGQLSNSDKGWREEGSSMASRSRQRTHSKRLRVQSSAFFQCVLYERIDFWTRESCSGADRTDCPNRRPSHFKCKLLILHEGSQNREIFWTKVSDSVITVVSIKYDLV